MYYPLGQSALPYSKLSDLRCHLVNANIFQNKFSNITWQCLVYQKILEMAARIQLPAS